MAEPVPGRLQLFVDLWRVGAGEYQTAPHPGYVPGAGRQMGFTMSLYDQIWSWPNLLLAYRRASRGKRGRGMVAAFEHRLEEHLFELQEALWSYTYRPGSYRNFLIHEPKRRLISAAPFPRSGCASCALSNCRASLDFRVHR